VGSVGGGDEASVAIVLELTPVGGDAITGANDQGAGRSTRQLV
jgi:hypothetical protein